MHKPLQEYLEKEIKQVCSGKGVCVFVSFDARTTHWQRFVQIQPVCVCGVMECILVIEIKN
jgi:hypothetical protein